jgi:uncharacterized repeat protein (TIGR01451 family)
MKKALLTIALITALTTTSFAASDQPIELTVEAEKEVTIINDGKQQTQRIPADSAQPGEVVIFTLTYRNNGDAPATNVVFNNPVSELASYIDGSAYGEGSVISFSVDGGKRFGILQGLKVRISEGSPELRAATAADVTHIRWVMESVPAKASGEVGFSALVK